MKYLEKNTNQSNFSHHKADQVGLKLIAKHQVLFYKDINVSGASIHSVKENTQASVFFSNENGLELNYKKTKYIVMS